tara:strand:+ start:7180 stop:7566 length:387 start_codon:yes stop_codon:yes gene_type:complete
MKDIKYKPIVWDLSWALIDDDGIYKHDFENKVMVFDDPDEDCSLIEPPKAEDLEWRQDEWHYTFRPQTEIGIILSKEDIDPESKMDNQQWQRCVERINSFKVDMQSIIDPLQEICDTIINEKEGSACK